LVPLPRRGTYFAHRTRWIHTATFFGLLAGGVVLQSLEPEATLGEISPAPGFACIFAVAGLFRVASAMVLLRSPEPRFQGLSTPEKSLQFFRTARGSNAWRLVIGAAVFHIGVYTAAPYFTPFMLKELGISYLAYMAVLGCQTVIKVFTMPLWGRLVDRKGARAAFQLGALFSALIPLPFLWVGNVPGLLLAYLFAGFAWGGYEVALFALMLESSRKRVRPLLFSVQMLCNGVGQVSGSMFGAGLLDATGYRLLFLVSFGLRMAVALTMSWLVRDLQPAVPGRREPLLLRIIGYRPSGGFNHRPILDPEPQSGEPESAGQQQRTADRRAE
jgi:predicted MFS family arabinose efflux permease